MHNTTAYYAAEYFLSRLPTKKMYELTISTKNAQSLPVLFVPFNTHIDTQGTHKKSKQSASQTDSSKKTYQQSQ